VQLGKGNTKRKEKESSLGSRTETNDSNPRCELKKKSIAKPRRVGRRGGRIRDIYGELVLAPRKVRAGGTYGGW